MGRVDQLEKIIERYYFDNPDIFNIKVTENSSKIFSLEELKKMLAPVINDIDEFLNKPEHEHLHIYSKLREERNKAEHDWKKSISEIKIKNQMLNETKRENENLSKKLEKREKDINNYIQENTKLNKQITGFHARKIDLDNKISDLTVCKNNLQNELKQEKIENQKLQMHAMKAQIDKSH